MPRVAGLPKDMKKALSVTLVLALSFLVFLSSNSTLASESASVTVTLTFKSEPSVASVDLSDETNSSWLLDPPAEKSEEKTQRSARLGKDVKKKGLSNGLTIKDEKQSEINEKSSSRNSVKIYYSDDL